MLLALDTANNQCAACIIDSKTNKILAINTETIGRGHAERLLPLISKTLIEACPNKATPDLPQWEKLTKIATAIGPGSFTGLRVGVSVARALGISQKIPVIGVSGFEAIMAAHLAENPTSEGNFCIAQDARRGEIFFQYFAPPLDALSPASEAKALSVDAFVAKISTSDTPLTLIGSASQMLQSMDLPPHITILQHDGEINIEILAQLAAKKSPADERPKPLYIRAADAKPQSPLLHLAPKSSL